MYTRLEAHRESKADITERCGPQRDSQTQWLASAAGEVGTTRAMEGKGDTPFICLKS